jgi:hypothetical protein
LRWNTSDYYQVFQKPDQAAKPSSTSSGNWASCHHYM